MLTPMQLEDLYHEYIGNLTKWIHDGIINVDLDLLHEHDLLNEVEEENLDDLTQYFHVIENIEKVTLFNEQFAIWIIPKMEMENPTTYVFISLIQNDHPHLEIVFQTRGIYNTPKYVLKVLQHFLVDMLETEATLTAIRKSQ